MDQPASAPTRRVTHAAAHRLSAAALRVAARVVMSSSLGMPAAAMLCAGVAHAEEAGGPIVIAGPNEKNPAALTELAEHMQAAPVKRAGSAASLAAATAQSLKQPAVARDADAFTRASQASGSIVIAGAGEAPAAPQMIRTNFKPDANGVVTIPAPGRANPNASVPDSRQIVPVVVERAAPAANGRAATNIDAAPDTSTEGGFDSLASRGEPPKLAADGKPVSARTSATNANASAAVPAPAARFTANRPISPAVAQQNSRTAAPAAAPAQPAPLPGQQDAEVIRTTALAFLQQQSAGLPGKVEITVASAFPRGLAECSALEPFMPTGARLWGRVTVGVRCAGQRPWTIYLQARISLHATYYLAGRAMSVGEVLTAADLVAREGDLTGLPQAIVTDPSQAVGSVTLTRVSAGMPLRRDILRSVSSVTIGQTVRVVAAGDGFAISSEGSAMNNASPGQAVRVKTANGQVISGVVKDGATVEIQL